MFLMEVNPPQSWPWKQNGTTVVATKMTIEVVNNWRSELQKNILKKSYKVTGDIGYHYNTWVTGVCMAYMFDRNSGGKTFQIEWLFESNLRSFGCFKKFSTALWFPLDPSCKGNLLIRVGWALQAEIITCRPK